MPRLRAPEPPLSDGVVTVRAKRPEDGDAVVAACRDPEIPRWTGVPRDYTLAHWKEWLEHSAMLEGAGEGLHLLIVDREDRLLGAIGINDVDWARRVGEIGYWIAPEARRRRVATRAVELLRDWAHETLGLERLEIMAHGDNGPSRAVAAAAGFVETGEVRPGPRPGMDPERVYVVYAWPAPSER